MSPIIGPSGGGGGYVPGSDRIVVSLNGLTISHGTGPQAIDWSFGVPFVSVVGTALALVGSNIVFVKKGCYAVHVHASHGAVNFGTGISVEARMNLGAGAAAADGDDATHPAGLTDPALSCNWVWTQDAGATLSAAIAVAGATDGYLAGLIAQIVRLSELAETP